MKNITEKVKILTGRKLSKKKMENAMQVSSHQMEDPDYFCAGFPDRESNRNYTLVMKVDDTPGYLKLSKTFGLSKYGPYNVWNSDIRKFYTPKGELEKKKVNINGTGRALITIYDPAGSRTGKTIKE